MSIKYQQSFEEFIVIMNSSGGYSIKKYQKCVALVGKSPSGVSGTASSAGMRGHELNPGHERNVLSVVDSKLIFVEFCVGRFEHGGF